MKIPKYDLVLTFVGKPEQRVVVGAPLGHCQQRGLQAMMYGTFVETPDGWEFCKPSGAAIRRSQEDKDARAEG